ncbi:MAG: hypothetical protein MUC36_16045 [Planctomycetes bacterium]|jgi:hypothetical protein|nr:hypothetical protein [Planctomycetota bacterium]
MKRWCLWFLLAPQTFLVAGLWQDAGLPPLDMAVLACLYLSFFAERRALPWLLLGLALGRCLVDEATLPVQVLVLGVPVAVLLPLRTLFFGQHWLWQAVAAALCAIAVPKLAGLCGRLFDQASATARLEASAVLWAALLLPPLLFVVRRLPPFRAFEEAA